MALGQTINRLLRPLGIRVSRVKPRIGAENPDLVAAIHYQQALEELHDALVHFQFPGLPYVEGRKELMLKLAGTTISEAMWILDALHRTMGLPGDVCEFGVAHGRTSAMLANEIMSSDKNLWLFDSFEGLPAPTEKDELIDDILNLGSMQAYRGIFKHAPTEVSERLAQVGFPTERTRIVPGFIEKTIKLDNLPQQVSFAYIDFDFYEPILVALAYLADHLAPGGVVVVDDYGFFSSGAQAAVDEFAAAHSDTFTLTTPPKWARHFAVLTRQA